MKIVMRWIGAIVCGLLFWFALDVVQHSTHEPFTLDKYMVAALTAWLSAMGAGALLNY